MELVKFPLMFYSCLPQFIFSHFSFISVTRKKTYHDSQGLLQCVKHSLFWFLQLLSNLHLA